MHRISTALAAAVGVLLVAQPAIAESVAVNYHDLDLTTKQGQRELRHRIDKAAKEVCGYNKIVTSTRLPSSEARACVKKAKQQIQQKLATVLERDKAGG